MLNVKERRIKPRYKPINATDKSTNFLSCNYYSFSSELASYSVYSIFKEKLEII